MQDGGVGERLDGTYHRGNAGAVLQLKGLTPSRDSITDYLEDAA